MADVIGSLLVTLGIDSKDVDAKAPGVRNKLSDIERSAGSTEKGFKGLTGAIESFGAALSGIIGIGVLTAFGKDIVKTNTQLYYLSQNLGMSATKLYAWGQMSKQLGGSAAAVQSFFGQVRGMYGQFMTGQQPVLATLFARVGINPIQAMSESQGALMGQLAERFKNYDKGPNRWKAASFLEASGVSPDMVNMILQGPAWVKGHEKQLETLSPTDRQVEASAQLMQKVVLVQTAINQVGNNLLTKIMPLLNQSANRLSSILAWLTKHGGTTEALAAGGVGVMGLSVLMGGLKMAGPIVAAFGAALGSISAPVLGVVAAIGALSIAIYAVVKNWKSISEAFNKHVVAPTVKQTTGVWNWLSGKWDEMQLKRSGMYGLAPGAGVHETVQHEELEKYFVSKGMSPGWAAAWAANVQSESGGVSNARGDNGLAYGIAQFHPNWLAAFKDKYGIPMSQAGWKQQADYLLYISRHEMATPKGLSEANKAAWIVSRFEKPADMAGASSTRGALAEQYLKGFPGASAAASSASTVSNTSHTSTDNSRVTNIGTQVFQYPHGAQPMTPAMARGMDWTFSPQWNFGQR